MATGAALVAVTLTVAQLSGHIPLAEMDREQSPEFADKNSGFVSERCHYRSSRLINNANFAIRSVGHGFSRFSIFEHDSA